MYFLYEFFLVIYLEVYFVVILEENPIERYKVAYLYYTRVHKYQTVKSVHNVVH